MNENSIKLETATFGGGCFWCTDAIFRELDGVKTVESGYSGGEMADPNYQAVCGGSTGHAEVIQVSFDPTIISFRDLLEIHMETHDPTTLNQQGADKGTQYRSVIFCHDDTQRQIAQELLQNLQAHFSRPIVTEIADFERFYKAESYHQDYYNQNDGARYCELVISPKLRKFREKFSKKLAVQTG